MTEQELIELFGDDFQEVIDNLQQGLPDGLDDLVRAVINNVLYDTIIFGNRIEQYVDNLLQQGMTMSMISDNLRTDMATGGRIFGELKNSVAAALQELVNQAGRLGQLEEWGSEFRDFVWITVAGHKVCPDCDLRGGEIDTWDNWIERGLPGSGWSVCRGYCYCILDPTGSLSDNVKVPSEIREKGI